MGEVHAIFPHVLPVVGGENDQRVLPPSELRKPVDEASDLLIDERDLGVVQRGAVIERCLGDAVGVGDEVPERELLRLDLLLDGPALRRPGLVGELIPRRAVPPVGIDVVHPKEHGRLGVGLLHQPKRLVGHHVGVVPLPVLLDLLVV